MDKYRPYGKHSKKGKRKLDAARYPTWGSLTSVLPRKQENRKDYRRKKISPDHPKNLPHFLQRNS